VLDSGGDHDAELVILIHGVGSRADRFRLNVDPLGAAGFRAIAVDLPGHGLAQKGHLPYSVPYYAAFLLDLMTALDVERASVVGTSLGGHIGAWAAVQEPSRIRSLVMVGTLGVVPLGLDTRTAISRSIAVRSRDGIEAKLNFVLEQTELITPSWIEEEYRINNSPGATEAFEELSDYFLNRVDDDVVGEQLSAVADGLSTLFVWGAQDRMVTLDVARAAQEVLKATPLVMLQRAGHVPYLERPEAFNDVTARFLSGDLGGDLVQTF
jgi:2-hydroxy-6-oxonona-2,4-dienedioate hydrolase